MKIVEQIRNISKGEYGRSHNVIEIVDHLGKPHYGYITVSMTLFQDIMMQALALSRM